MIMNQNKHCHSKKKTEEESDSSFQRTSFHIPAKKMITKILPLGYKSPQQIENTFPPYSHRLGKALPPVRVTVG